MQKRFSKKREKRKAKYNPTLIQIFPPQLQQRIIIKKMILFHDHSNTHKRKATPKPETPHRYAKAANTKPNLFAQLKQVAHRSTQSLEINRFRDIVVKASRHTLLHHIGHDVRGERDDRHARELLLRFPLSNLATRFIAIFVRHVKIALETLVSKENKKVQSCGLTRIRE